MRYFHTGGCPRCGAPIFAVGTAAAGKEPGRDLVIIVGATTDAPTVHYTCGCHKTLPAIPDGDVQQPGTVAQGDRKYVEQLREDARTSRAEK